MDDYNRTKLELKHRQPGREETIAYTDRTAYQELTTRRAQTLTGQLYQKLTS